MRPADTSPEAWEKFLEVQRAMSPEERFVRTIELSDFLMAAAETGVRQQYRNADDREVFLRLARRRLGRDLFERVYGDVLPHDEFTRRRA